MALSIYASIVACAALLLAVLYSQSPAPQRHLPEFSPVNIRLASPEAAVERFAGTLRFDTVSSYEADNHAVKPDEFKALHKYMRQQWPQVFAALEVQEVCHQILTSACLLALRKVANRLSILTSTVVETCTLRLEWRRQLFRLKRRILARRSASSVFCSSGRALTRL